MHESEDWDFFVEAKSLALELDYSDEDYIEAQFHYFKKWFNLLPKPHHLCSKKALDRAIDYEKFTSWKKEELSEEESRKEQKRLLKKLMKIWYLTTREALNVFGGDRGLFTERFVKDELEKDDVLRDRVLLTFKTFYLDRFKNLTPLDRCCFLFLLVEALENFYEGFKEGRSPFIWIPQKKICTKLGASLTTLQKSLKHLKEVKLIDTNQDGNKTLIQVVIPDPRTEEEIKKDTVKERQAERFRKHLERGEKEKEKDRLMKKGWGFEEDEID